MVSLLCFHTPLRLLHSIFLASRSGVTTQAGAEDWQIICMCALSKLDEVVQNIHTGNISNLELRKVKHREPQLHKLLDAVSAHEGRIDIKDLDAQILQRMREFKDFLLLHEQMHNLISSLSTAGILQGIKL